MVKDFEARLAEAKAAQAEAEAAEAQREALFATIGAKGEGSEVKEAQIDPSSDANAGIVLLRGAVGRGDTRAGV